MAFVYMYRLGDAKKRQLFCSQINSIIINYGFSTKKNGWDVLNKVGAFENIVNEEKDRFCSHFIVEEGIAMNNALSENLFVSTICILNKIPR
jgi:hypothetical protein